MTVTDPSGGRRVAGSGESRRGVALIMVLVLIVMISLAAYTFAGKMAAQERGTEMAARRVQAEAAVASGVEYIKDYLSMLPEDRAAVGGHWDNVYFKDVAVSDSTLVGVETLCELRDGAPVGVHGAAIFMAECSGEGNVSTCPIIEAIGDDELIDDEQTDA